MMGQYGSIFLPIQPYPYIPDWKNNTLRSWYTSISHETQTDKYDHNPFVIFGLTFYLVNREQEDHLLQTMFFVLMIYEMILSFTPLNTKSLDISSSKTAWKLTVEANPHGFITPSIMSTYQIFWKTNKLSLFWKHLFTRYVTSVNVQNMAPAITLY